MTNKELIVEFYKDVFNNRNLSKIDRYIHDDYIQHNARVEDGKAGFLKFCERFLALEPQMKIYSVVSEGDRVCVFFQCTLGANGKVNKVFDMYRIEDGKLAEHWDCIEHDVDRQASVNGNGLF